MTIRWKRSTEGYCDSHCGRWKITPLYCGRVKPQFFDLYRDGQKVALMLSSQRQAKDRADALLANAPGQHPDPSRR